MGGCRLSKSSRFMRPTSRRPRRESGYIACTASGRRGRPHRAAGTCRSRDTGPACRPAVLRERWCPPRAREPYPTYQLRLDQRNHHFWSGLVWVGVTSVVTDGVTRSLLGLTLTPLCLAFCGCRPVRQHPFFGFVSGDVTHRVPALFVATFGPFPQICVHKSVRKCDTLAFPALLEDPPGGDETVRQLVAAVRFGQRPQPYCFPASRARLLGRVELVVNLRPHHRHRRSLAECRWAAI
jgi:hypothetical protein